MVVYRSLQDIQKQGLRHCAVTLGSFDGVHQGHRQLIRRLQESHGNAPLVVLTFSPHPGRILFPDRSQRLFSEQDQIEIFQTLGVDHLFYIPFDKALAEMSAEDFIELSIWQPLQPSAVVVGYDFVFGKNRRGNACLLKEVLESRGTEVQQIPAVQIQGETVSSRAIRSFILAGDLAKAELFLGRPYYIEGEVIVGKKLGTQIGVPTANLKLSSEIVPPPGVYVATVQIDGKTYRAVGNRGVNPTVSSDHLQKVEFHILDFSGDLYNSTLRFHLHTKLREEMRFSSLDALKSQIQQDIKAARSFAVLRKL